MLSLNPLFNVKICSMARPRKMDEEKRDFTIRVRVTPSEKKQLVKYAGQQGLTTSDFMRLRSISSAPLFRKATPERAAFIKNLAELGKIGSNVNQIARALNQSPEAIVPSQLLTNALHGIDTLTHQLINLLANGH